MLEIQDKAATAAAEILTDGKDGGVKTVPLYVAFAVSSFPLGDCCGVILTIRGSFLLSRRNSFEKLSRRWKRVGHSVEADGAAHNGLFVRPGDNILRQQVAAAFCIGKRFFDASITRPPLATLGDNQKSWVFLFRGTTMLWCLLKERERTQHAQFYDHTALE